MAGATNAVAAPAKGKPAVAVTATRVEGLAHAEGIDCPRPRFSWQLDASVPNVKQTAYRIRVASSPQLLRKGKADLWDSGRQPSDRPQGDIVIEANRDLDGQKFISSMSLGGKKLSRYRISHDELTRGRHLVFNLK